MRCNVVDMFDSSADAKDKASYFVHAKAMHVGAW